MAFLQRSTSEGNAEKKEQRDIDSAEVLHLEEGSNVEGENSNYQSTIAYVLSQFQRSKDKRRNDETRWLRQWQNFRGLYESDVQFLENEKSRVFIKVTKTKVLAGYAQITDVLFAGARFPIGIQPSKVSNGAPEKITVETQPTPADKASFSTITRQSIAELVGPLRDKLKDVPQEQVTEGPGKTPTAVTYSPTQIAAAEMEKNIHDQLEASQVDKHLRSFAFEMACLGTGIMKGPLATLREYPKWTEDGEYVPKSETSPDSMAVSIWNAYPDPDARNMQECEFFIERHRKSRSDLKRLKKMPFFRSKSIDKAIEMGTNYLPEYWESMIEDNPNVSNIERFEVLEYWGMIDAEIAKEDMDFDLPAAVKDNDTLQVNIWVCNNQLLRLVLNPFTPARIPYHAAPYEINPYSFFGVGIAENMEDTQTVMNGFMRLAIDNAALSGNVMLEVNEDYMVPGQDMKVYPGKVWKRSGGAPGQAVYSMQIQNTSQENLMMFDKARQLADESTGIQSYSHGGTGIGGVGKTAAGMSMLMGASAQNIKSVVRNIDDYLLAPLGRDYFAFNMQFNFDKKFTEGDLEVVALGTESLMRNEVRSQKILQLMQTVAGNPAYAPLLKNGAILREFITSIDLDSDEFINDDREALLQAMAMKAYAEAMGPAGPQGPQDAQGGPPAVSDPTGNGNGNIAPGAAPEPGAAGYTGVGGMTGGGAAANQVQAQPPMQGAA